MTHAPELPHDIRGDGLVTACPLECPKHEEWVLARVVALEEWADVWIRLGDAYRDAFYGRRHADADRILAEQRAHLRRRPPEAT